MKQIIDVPAGHTVTIRQEGSQLIVETTPPKRQDEQVFIALKDGERLRNVGGKFRMSWRR